MSNPIGQQRWSDYFNQNVQCVGYINDDWWYFKLTVPTKFTQDMFDRGMPVWYRSKDKGMPELRAQSRWSSMKPTQYE